MRPRGPGMQSCAVKCKARRRCVEGNVNIGRAVKPASCIATERRKKYLQEQYSGGRTIAFTAVKSAQRAIASAGLPARRTRRTSRCRFVSPSAPSGHEVFRQLPNGQGRTGDASVTSARSQSAISSTRPIASDAFREFNSIGARIRQRSVSRPGFTPRSPRLTCVQRLRAGTALRGPGAVAHLSERVTR